MKNVEELQSAIKDLLKKSEEMNMENVSYLLDAAQDECGAYLEELADIQEEEKAQKERDREYSLSARDNNMIYNSDDL